MILLYLTAAMFVGLMALAVYMATRAAMDARTARLEYERPEERALGYEGVDLSTSDAPTTHLAGVPVSITWVERRVKGKKGTVVERITLTAQTPQLALGIHHGAPSTSSARVLGSGGPLDRFHVVNATESERLCWLSATFCDALARAMDGNGAWTLVELSGGELRFERGLEEGKKRSVKGLGQVLIERAERVLEALPERIEPALTLERRACRGRTGRARPTRRAPSGRPRGPRRPP